MQFSYFIKHLIILLSSAGFSVGISCKDEADEDVDWFIVYKLPLIKEEGDVEEKHLAAGCAYAFISSAAPHWTLSNHSVEAAECMLGRTWHEFHSHAETVLAHLFYNDAAPEGYSGSANGHLKGMIAFDSEEGFWLVHSIPKFGVPQKYEYPKNALSNGQTAICITLTTEAMNDICNHLLFCGLNIYENHLSAEGGALLDEAAQTLFSESPRFVKKAPFERMASIRTSSNLTFQIFAKDNQLDIDIYSGMLAPGLKVPLVAETWQRGAGTPLEAFCDEPSVTDALSIGMRVVNRPESLISFRSTQDHSKWAVSGDQAFPFFCMGDLNRMESQAKRGGGAICLRSKPIWEAFHSLVNQTNECEIEQVGKQRVTIIS